MAARVLTIELLLCHAVTCAVAQDRPPAAYELTLTTPDGRPVAGRRVLIRQWNDPDPSSPVLETTSDVDGRVRFERREMPTPLLIQVPGRGFATASITAGSADGVYRPAVPRLVPYAAIECIVPEDLRGEIVELEPTPSFVSGPRPPPDPMRPDARGRAVFRNLEPGEYSVYLRNAEHSPIAFGSASCRPGKTIAIRRFERPLKFVPHEPVPLLPRTGEPVRWCAGTLRTPDGRPVAGATVMARGNDRASPHQPAGPEMEIVTHTDDRGRWEIRGPNPLCFRDFTAEVYCGKQGAYFGTTTLPPPQRTTGEPQRKPEPPMLNFTAPDRLGELRVCVYFEGTRCPGARVAANPAFGRIALGTHPEISPPAQTTDAEGYALFRGLSPGAYAVMTTTDPEFSWGGYQGYRNTRFDSGVVVRPEARAEYSVNLLDPPYDVEFDLESASGEKVPRKSLVVLPRNVYRDRFAASGFSHPLPRDARGLLPLTAGLWEAALADRRRDDPQWYSTVSFEEARVAFGSSTLLRGLEPIRVRQVRRRPANLTIELRDEQDRPCQGQVLVGGFAGSTDERGVVRFDAVDPGTFEILPYASDEREPDLATWPTDSELIGRRVLRRQMVTVALDHDMHIVVRPREVAYLRGRLATAPGRRTDDYRIFNLGLGTNAGLAYNPSTGEFLTGPYDVDALVTLAVARRRDPAAEDAAWENLSSALAWVRSGRVVEVRLTDVPSIDKPADDMRQASDEIRVTVGGKATERLITAHGRVILADGTTPAAGALVRLVTPRTTDPPGYVEAGTAGEYSLSHRFYFGLPGATDSQPGESYVVARLAGRCGAAFVSLESPPPNGGRIILPNPISARGVVRVTGGSTKGWNNRFFVSAAYIGRPELREMLDVAADPALDGTFELPALTPGRYRVQASLDGIWLSQSVELTVTDDGGPLAPITLDIPQPGLPCELRCVDGDGRPQVGVRFAVRRPAGPLAERSWPKELSSDGAGVVQVPPLEAGEHVVVSLDDGREHRITIPPIDKRVKRPEFQIVLGRKKANAKPN